MTTQVSAGLILVVEDDDSMRTAMERLLRSCDFDCHAYASAEALLARGVGADAACIVSDMQLPGMSGIELLDRTRAGGGPPLILITAYDRPGLAEEATRHGAAAYLTKPFRGTTLVEAIRATVAAAPD